ncbi:hypothetical protein AB3S75_006384 [Citrus x aurantiifolia]
MFQHTLASLQPLCPDDKRSAYCNSSKALPSFSVLLMIILQLIPRLHHGGRKKKIATAAYGTASNATKTLVM